MTSSSNPIQSHLCLPGLVHFRKLRVASGNAGVPRVHSCVCGTRPKIFSSEFASRLTTEVFLKRCDVRCFDVDTEVCIQQNFSMEVILPNSAQEFFRHAVSAGDAGQLGIGALKMQGAQQGE